MDIVYVVCPKCNYYTTQKKDEYPVVCCGVWGITIGSGKCCKCFIPLPEDYDISTNGDVCITCLLKELTINDIT